MPSIPWVCSLAFLLSFLIAKLPSNSYIPSLLCIISSLLYYSEDINTCFPMKDLYQLLCMIFGFLLLWGWNLQSSVNVPSGVVPVLLCTDHHIAAKAYLLPGTWPVHCAAFQFSIPSFCRDDLWDIPIAPVCILYGEHHHHNLLWLCLYLVFLILVSLSRDCMCHEDKGLVDCSPLTPQQLPQYLAQRFPFPVFFQNSLICYLILTL